MGIVAIDPGPHTGIATRHADGRIETWMIHNDLEGVWRLVCSLEPRAIVVERFATSGRISAPGLQTVEIVGSMYALAWTLEAKIVRHTPAQRMPRLREAKEMLRGIPHTDHNVDALAHLLVYEVQERIARARQQACKA